jgi:hypothetical protein
LFKQAKATTFQDMRTIIEDNSTLDDMGLAQRGRVESDDPATTALAAFEGVDAQLFKAFKAFLQGVKQNSGGEVFVGRLSPDATDVHLTQAFERFGKIVSVKILKNADGSSKKCGFVNFDNEFAAKGAVNDKAITILGGVVRCEAAKPKMKSSAYYSSVQSSENTSSLNGLVDSGCTPHHLTPSKEPLQTLSTSPEFNLEIANGTTMPSAGMKGNFTGSDPKGNVVSVKDVQVVPGLSNTLFSTYAFLKDNKDVWFKSDDLSVNIGKLDPSAKNQIEATGTAHKGLFQLNLKGLDSSTANLASGYPYKKTWDLWHSRFMHAGHSIVKRTLESGAVRGFKVEGGIPEDQVCVSCVQGKMHRRTHSHSHMSLENLTAPKLSCVSLDLLHMPLPSLGGAIYFLGITVNSANGFKIGYACKRKSEVKDKLVFAKQYLENLAGEKISMWRFDKGGENRPAEFLQICYESGIVISETGTEEHESNGQIENWWRHAMDNWRSHQIATDCNMNLWADGLCYQAYIYNRLVHAGHSVTPFQALTGKVPSVHDLRTFGCQAFAYTLPKNRTHGKLSPRATPGIFIGLAYYDGHPLQQHGGYKILTNLDDPKSIICTRDVYFVENKFTLPTETVVHDEGEKLPHMLQPHHGHNDDGDDDIAEQGEPQPGEPEEQLPGEGMLPDEISDDQPYEMPDEMPDELPDELPHDDIAPVPQPAVPQSDHDSESDVESDGDIAAVPQPELPEMRRLAQPNQRRGRSAGPIGDWSSILPWGKVASALIASALLLHTGPPMIIDQLPDWEYYATALLTHPGPPINVALNDPAWRIAMKKEDDQMKDMGVYELVPLPVGKKPLPSLWVLVTKVNEQNGTEEKKARWVVDGSKQIKGDSYDKAFASTPSMTSFKTLLAIKTARRMKAIHIDWTAAHLNPLQDYEVYVRQPKGFEEPGKEYWVRKLIHAVYGEKQAAYLWERTRDAFLLDECGFEKCPFEPCTFIKRFGSKMILCDVHADDAPIFYDLGLEAELETILNKLQSKFKLKIQRKLHQHLNMTITSGDDWTSLDQIPYLNHILSVFQENQLEQCRTPWSTDIDEEFDKDLDPTPEEVLTMETKDYWGLAGKLQYLVNTRPDIAYSVGKLLRKCSKPRPIHWKAAQRLLAYLRATPDLKLMYREKEGLEPKCYSDADFAGDRETRRSTSGMTILLCGASIVASSKRQPTVADSTVAAEIIALQGLVKECIWLRNFLQWVGYSQERPMTLYCDNQGAVRNCEEGAERTKTKHLDIKYMFIRDTVSTGQVQIQYISTNHMIADMLTKGLRKYQFEYCRDNIGLLKGSVENGDRVVDDVSKPEEEPTSSHLTLATPVYVTASMQSHMQTV